MRTANAVVATLLRSPMHRLLSGSMDLIRYNGRRSGREFTTPTQYARAGDDVIILVGRPNAKTWWRNFTSEHDIDILMRRHWIPMKARAVVGAEEPATIAPLLDAFLERFPKAARALEEGSNESLRRSAVIVWCRPR
jgi:hypothetical protein